MSSHPDNKENRTAKDSSNPFSDWDSLMHLPVYSSDGKKVGFLRAVINNYMIVKRGFVSLHKYIIPLSVAESVDNKKRIRLRISHSEIRSSYSHLRLSDLEAVTRSLPEEHIKQKVHRDRLQTLRHGFTRNRLAGTIATVSGVLFLVSGYKASLATYELIERQIESIESLRAIWNLVVIPLGALAILSQLSGITVLAGAGFFAANRVNLGKFLIMIGTGQGLLTILWRLFLDISSGNPGAANNFVLWLTSTAAGLGVVFALLAQSISKGKGQSIVQRTFRFILRRKDPST